MKLFKQAAWVLLAASGCVAPDSTLTEAEGVTRQLPPAATPHTFTPLVNQPTVAITVPILLRDGTVIAQEVSTPNWWKLAPDANGSYLAGTWSQMASMPSDYGPLYY